MAEGGRETTDERNRGESFQVANVFAQVLEGSVDQT